MHEILTPRNRWYGGFYELAIQVGPTGNDVAIADLLKTFWMLPNITGPYETNEIEPTDKPVVTADPDERHYYGFTQLSDGHTVVCGTYVVKETCEPGGSDWVLLYVPAQDLQSKLGSSDKCTKNIGEVELAPLVDFLVEAAGVAFNVAEFKLGLIGFEVSGETYAETITANDIQTLCMGVLLPHGHGLIKEAKEGRLLPSGLVWYPPKAQKV